MKIGSVRNRHPIAWYCWPVKRSPWHCPMTRWWRLGRQRTGIQQHDVANQFKVHHSTVLRLRQRLRQRYTVTVLINDRSSCERQPIRKIATSPWPLQVDVLLTAKSWEITATEWQPWGTSNLSLDSDKRGFKSRKIARKHSFFRITEL